VTLAHVDVHRRTPFGDGRYERLHGVARFAVDPDAPENAGITDLRLAPRDAGGTVRFEADFCVLRPSDPGRASGRLLFQVANRGRHSSVPFSVLTAPPSAEVTERIDPGDGFLLRRGWTVAWCGWQWDVTRRPGILGLVAPEARLPIDQADGEVLVQFQPHQWTPHQGLGHWPLDPPPGLPDRAHRPYRPRDAEDPRAVLAVRDRAEGPVFVIPRGSWCFAREVDRAVVPDDTCVWLEGGFEPGRTYEVSYRPRECPVVGAGLLAVRDFVAGLRRGWPELTNRGVDNAFAFGVSQSGRFLREFLHRGLNLDGTGRRVFDGVIVHVAGARRGEFNQRYGQPSVQHAPGLGHLPPFADAPLLDRQRAIGGVPRIFSINTSSEYWRSEASLTHTDHAGVADVESPPEVRTYLFAGCQHGPGALALTRTSAISPWVRPGNPLNTVDYTPLLRAALINLERWVVDGVEPPPSAVPRVAEGTAVDRAEVLRRFAASEAELLRADRLPTLRRLDLGDRTEDGIARFPAVAGEALPCLVSSVDADLNEEAGIRLPDLTVPLASHTGWNPRRRGSGAAGELIDMLGSTVPLARTPEERRRTRDRRRSIAERYASRDEYCRLVREATERLVGERHLLEEDVGPVVARAAFAYDLLADPERPAS